MLRNREGERVPEVTFRTRLENRWVDVTSAELFAGRTVAAFALPGAFTPTCSASHLPRFEELAPLFHENGVDEVICLAVNDAYVMEAWRKEQKISRVRLVPDGNGEFAAGMGMLVDMRHLGFGMRSWRYSMLVRDGRIEKMFVEPEREGDPFEVSGAETLLGYINPRARAPDVVSLFTREGCPHCARARELLQRHDIPYEEIRVGRDVSERTLRAVTGAETVPQVFQGGRRIGGADDLEHHLELRARER